MNLSGTAKASNNIKWYTALNAIDHLVDNFKPSMDDYMRLCRAVDRMKQRLHSVVQVSTTDTMHTPRS